MAEADILTASLRANPIFYADSQLIPYGKYTRDRPGGQTQYDVNISYPLDVSHKRRARTQVAVRAKRVLEAQYQDAVAAPDRQPLHGLCRRPGGPPERPIRPRQRRGAQKVLLVTQRLYEKDQTNRADVNRVKVQVDAARIGLADAEESLRRSSRVAGGPPEPPPARIRVARGPGDDPRPGAPAPPTDEMLGVALATRPDLVELPPGRRPRRGGRPAGPGQPVLRRLRALSALYVPGQRPARA